MDKYLRPPPFELFFLPLAIALPPNDLERVQFAYIASKYGHRGQERSDGTRYFDHPKAAAWIYIRELDGRDPEVIINTLLHDLSEDTYLLSPHRISLNFGEERALDVGALTKLRKNKDGVGRETTPEYLKRVIARGPRAIIAKLLDRLHNLRTLQSMSPAKQTETLAETRTYHLPMLIDAFKSYNSPMAEMLQELYEEAISEAEAATDDSSATA